MLNSSKMNEEGLEKIYVDLPNHWAIGGESLWATPLGNDLFRLENIPFYAYGLNFQDIVKTASKSDAQIPEIQVLIEFSGHRTFRVFFKQGIDQPKQEEVLKSMQELTISYEQANDIYFSLDMQPNGNYQAVFDRLAELEQENGLGFETCEARVEGSFDDFPEEN